MPMFFYESVRSAEKADQAPGMKCSMFTLSGTISANSVNGVKEIVTKLMVIPGVYTLSIRNTAEGSEWKNMDKIDTRNPEVAADAVQKSKKSKRAS